MVGLLSTDLPRLVLVTNRLRQSSLEGLSWQAGIDRINARVARYDRHTADTVAPSDVDHELLTRLDNNY